MHKNGISLVIFCYNSENRIQETLVRIVNQKFTKGIEWEVIVIDNNSTDKTLEVTERVWKSLDCKVSFQIVTEKKQGTSYARLKGIQSANYDIVAFVDDDNRLFENWVEQAFHFMTKSRASRLN